MDLEQAPRIDVSQLPQGRFAPHGDLQVWHQGPLLCLAAAGPFNAEMVGAFWRSVGLLLQTWTPPPAYVALAWWQRSLMASPDTFSAYADLLRRGAAVLPPERANFWLVGADVEDAALMKPRWTALYASAGRRLEFCATEAEMLARARVVLAQVSPES